MEVSGSHGGAKQQQRVFVVVGSCRESLGAIGSHWESLGAVGVNFPTKVLSVRFGIFTGQVSNFVSTNPILDHLNREFGEHELDWAISSSKPLPICSKMHRIFEHIGRGASKMHRI